jgi:acetyl-CoA/propionyl-CoA carboxylase biotin carboxyl carrier protein
VNTRLQVEHPVSEEVTGIDLVREQFRIADGEELGYDDPAPRGHSFEFRINAEDAGRGFLPAPGTLTRFDPPAGPGVRLDAGYTAGMTVPGSYDSLIAKLIVTGATRAEALERARRALAEFSVEGMPTVLPFHRLVVTDPTFTGPSSLDVHTRWIETEFTGVIAPFEGGAPAAEPGLRETITVEVGGKRLEVTLPASVRTPAGPAPAERPRRRVRSSTSAPAGDALISPMQGTIIKIAVSEGQLVSAGDVVVVLEAMKMEQPLVAHKDGMVTGLTVTVGQTVSSGATICTLASSED